jgi:uncharacterized protein YndB with AHSA1/START domain
MPKTSDPLVKVTDIDAPCEYVFDFILQPGNLIRWIGVSAEIDPRPGGLVRIDPNGRDVICGTVLEIVRPTKIAFTWGWERRDSRVPAGSSVVEITLEPIGSSTRLTLVHKKLPHDMRDGHDAGWTHYLGRLKIVAEGGDPGPDALATPAVRHG